ncbi:MAG: 2-hydroxyacyl-CoA dehydratase [Deltaproteobacteria bacterium]|nr:2-hydroxyacyl-CoA dehydratase [Deltaproteobacteria bacterium]
MNYLEIYAAILNDRVKMIKEHPNAKQYKSNALLYEMLSENATSQLKAVQDGGLFAFSHGLDDILVPMGFTCFSIVGAADRVGFNSDAYYRLIRGAGYPTTICDRFQMGMGIVLSGHIPRPHLVAPGQACDVETWLNIATAHIMEVPYYFLDFRHRTNISMDHLMDQIHELIDRIEKEIPGAKFNKDMFLERRKKTQEAQVIFHKIGQMLKAKPCPVSAKDAFRIVPPWIAKIHPRGLEYVRELHDEIKDRVDRGFSPNPDEKLRIMWAVSGPFFGSLFKVLEKHKASMPIFMWSHVPEQFGLVPKCFYDVGEFLGREPTDLEEMTSSLLSTWTGPVTEWVDEIEMHCRELDIDGVVYYQLSGCPTNLPAARQISDRLEEELDIPLLPLQGWMVDKEMYNKSDSEDRLDAFLTMCLQRKKVREGSR